MFRKKKEDPKATAAAKKASDIKIIEKFFPVEKGISSLLCNNDLIDSVVDIATGKVASNSYKFLKLLGYDPDSAENLKKFDEMTAALK